MTIIEECPSSRRISRRLSIPPTPKSTRILDTSTRATLYVPPDYLSGCLVDTPITQVITQMAQSNTTFTLVRDITGIIVGIVTPEDILYKVIAENQDLNQVTAKDIMQINIDYITDEEHILGVFDSMVKNGIKHLLVYKSNGGGLDMVLEPIGCLYHMASIIEDKRALIEDRIPKEFIEEEEEYDNENEDEDEITLASSLSPTLNYKKKYISNDEENLLTALDNHDDPKLSEILQHFSYNDSSSSTSVPYINSKANLLEASQLMKQLDVNILIIKDEINNIIGSCSSQNIINQISEFKLNPTLTKIGEIMSLEVQNIPEIYNTIDLIKQMSFLEYNVWNIVNSNDKLIGSIDVFNLSKFFLKFIEIIENDEKINGTDLTSTFGFVKDIKKVSDFIANHNHNENEIKIENEVDTIVKSKRTSVKIDGYGSTFLNNEPIFPKDSLGYNMTVGSCNNNKKTDIKLFNPGLNCLIVFKFKTPSYKTHHIILSLNDNFKILYKKIQSRLLEKELYHLLNSTTSLKKLRNFKTLKKFSISYKTLDDEISIINDNSDLIRAIYEFNNEAPSTDECITVRLYIHRIDSNPLTYRCGYPLII